MQNKEPQLITIHSSCHIQKLTLKIPSVQFSHSVVSHSLRPHESQHARPPCPSICQQIWKTQQWPQDWKRSVFIPIPKKSNAKECSNYCTIALISHAIKILLKILQARLQQYVNQERPDVQDGLRKGRGTRGQIANICWIITKEREFQKSIHFCFIDYAKAFVWITINCGELP